MIKPGTLLQDRYRVVQQVGKGGMGEVYLAMDERFQSRVAIKRTFFDDPEMCKAFKREARLLNHLRHPALPRVSDHFSEGDGQFLVMEFIAGFDFAELLARRKVPFPLSDVLRWADELLDALEYLHTQEPPVVHRDIKPPNIKLTPRGKIILLDFGLAKGAPTQTASGTASSVVGYSLHYAPLEQMQGSGTDPRSDLYSLAATLYSLLTAVRPADALTRASAAIKGQPDPLRPAHLVQPQVPVAVSQILQRAMSQNPALRHATAAELRAALRQAAKAAAASQLDAEPLAGIGKQAQADSANALAQSMLAPEAATPLDESPVRPHGPAVRPGQARPQPAASAKLLQDFSPARAEAATQTDSPNRARISNSYSVTVHAAPMPAPAPVEAKKTFRLVACLLVVCVAAGAYLLTRASGSSAPAASAEAEAQNPAATSQQLAPTEAKAPASGVVVSDSSQGANGSYTQAQSTSEHSASERTGAESQSAAAETASAPVQAGQEAKAGGANSDSTNGAAASVSTSGRPALVIQNPTNADVTRRAEEARRIEESRREQRPEYTDRPPPGPAYPPPPGDRPPPDGRRPPPPQFRPHP